MLYFEQYTTLEVSAKQHLLAELTIGSKLKYLQKARYPPENVCARIFFHVDFCLQKFASIATSDFSAFRNSKELCCSSVRDRGRVKNVKQEAETHVALAPPLCPVVLWLPQEPLPV